MDNSCLNPFLLSQIVIFLFNLIHYIVRIYFGDVPWEEFWFEIVHLTNCVLKKDALNVDKGKELDIGNMTLYLYFVLIEGTTAQENIYNEEI